MAILKNPNRDKFTIIDNYALADKNLSLKTRGLLVTMLSLPDNWQFSENGLNKIFPKDGQTSIRTGLKELQENGYLIRERTRDEQGRMSKVNWIIYDRPRLENPNLVNPNLENRPQYNTNISNTNKSNININNNKRFTPPTFEEVKKYCKERNNNVDPKKFYDFYSTPNDKGQTWVDSNGKQVKNWKQKVITWEGRQKDAREATIPKPTTSKYNLTYTIE